MIKKDENGILADNNIDSMTPEKATPGQILLDFLLYYGSNHEEHHAIDISHIAG